MRRGDHIGPVGVRRSIKIGVRADQDIERAAGAEFNDRRHGPIGSCSIEKSLAIAHATALVNAAQDKTVALIESRAGALMVWPEIILRLQQRLQISGVIDGVRPGIRGQELVVVAEPLFEVRRQAMVDRAAIGIVGHHVAKGNGHAEAQSVGRQHFLDEPLAKRAPWLQRQGGK